MSFLFDIHSPDEATKGFALDMSITLVAGTARQSPSGLTYVVAGFAALGDELISPDDAVDEAVLRRALEDPAALSTEFHGGVALFVHDSRTGRSVAVNDPFGACSLKVYRDARRTVVSTDLNLLYVHLKENGVTLRKSIDHLASMFATGVGGFASAPYEGVTILPIGTWVSATPQGVEIEELDLGALVSEWSDIEYDEGLDRVHADIQGTFRALESRHDVAPIAHLTGGADSRLVLSYLQALGAEERYLFYCSGHSGETDRVVFEKLARHFDLRAAIGAGVSVLRYPASLEEELTGPLDYSSGLNMSGPTKDWARTDTMILSGGYGETFRSPYGADPELVLNSSPRERLQFAWNNNLNVGGSPGSSYVADDFIDALAEATDPIVQRGLDAGLSPDAALDLLYVARNRMFVGNLTYDHNDFVRRIDPLYSLKGALFALTRPLDLRKGNVIGFDLTARNAPDLLRLPFDSERFDENYLRYRPRPEPLEFQGADRSLRTAAPLRIPTREYPVMYRPKPTPEQEKFAREKKASLRQVVWAETVRARLGQILDKVDPAEFDRAFNVDVVRGALARPFPNRVVIRNMMTLYALLQWYDH
ncbi:hypothetical protein [Brachybacterium tyrofermentans]|uniref:hypothetical protein n=1 Tax=Brachybacterium tyrofermentans TaxID=47848 RepID=UPI003D24D7E4